MDPNKIFRPESFAPTYSRVIKIIKPTILNLAQNEKIPLIMHSGLLANPNPSISYVNKPLLPIKSLIFNLRRNVVAKAGS